MRVCPKCHGCLTEPTHAPCNVPTTEVDAPDLPPALAEKFERLTPLALGATGMLYRATHTETGVAGVLKLVDAAVSGSGNERMRLKRELRKQTTLPGAILAPPIDGGEDGKQLWLFRGYVEGVSLSVHLATLAAAGQTMPIAHSLSIVAQIAVGLDELHRNGLLHRDLKPAHVMLESVQDGASSVRLIDAGLPPRIGSEGVFDLMGTPGYMSPEQAAGRMVSFRSDLYSLGCLFYELVAGKPLFTGDVADVLAAQREGLVPEVEQSLPDVARDLLRTLLDKEPRRRPFSAQQVRRSLEPSLDAPLPSVPAPRVVREKARGFVGASVPPPPPTAASIRAPADASIRPSADASIRPAASAGGRRSVAPPIPASATGRPSAAPPPPPGSSSGRRSAPPPPPPGSSGRLSSVPPIPPVALQGRPGANATQELQLGDVQIEGAKTKEPRPHGRPVEQLHTAELRVMTLDEDEDGNERPTQMLGTGEIEIVATPGPRTQHLNTQEFQTLMVDEDAENGAEVMIDGDSASEPIVAEPAEPAGEGPEDTNIGQVESEHPGSDQADGEDGGTAADTPNTAVQADSDTLAARADADVSKAPQPEPSIVFNHDSSTPPPAAPRPAVDFDVESLFGADHGLDANQENQENQGEDDDNAPTLAFDRASMDSLDQPSVGSSMPPALADSTGRVQLQSAEAAAGSEEGPTVVVSAAEMADLARASKAQATGSAGAGSIPGWAYAAGAAAALMLVLWMLSGDEAPTNPAVAEMAASKSASAGKSAAKPPPAVAQSQKPQKSNPEANAKEGVVVEQAVEQFNPEETAKAEQEAAEQDAAEQVKAEDAAKVEQEAAEQAEAEEVAKAEREVAKKAAKAEQEEAKSKSKSKSTQAAAKRGKAPSKADVDALKADARKYFSAKKFPRAARAYKRVTVAAPRDSGAFAGLGASQLAMGDAKAAVAAYRRAVKLRPKTSGFHAALGRAYYESGNEKRAKVAYKKALSLNPKNKAAQAALVRLK